MLCGAWSEFFSSMLTKEPQNQCLLFHLKPFKKWLKNIVSSLPCTSICCQLFQHFFGQLSEHFTPCWKVLVWVFWTPSLHVLYLIGWISGLSNHSNLRLERINKMRIYVQQISKWLERSWKIIVFYLTPLFVQFVVISSASPGISGFSHLLPLPHIHCSLQTVPKCIQAKRIS